MKTIINSLILLSSPHITNGSSESQSDLAEEIVVSDVLSTGTFCISSPVSDTTMAE